MSNAITTANTFCPTSTISITNDITLDKRLPFIDSDITINGNNNFISGNNTYRVLFVKSGTVTLSDVTIKDGQAKGGDGGDGGYSAGGGGAGLGAGLFLYDGDVAFNNVTFDNNQAIGGDGGSYAGSGGSGGGGGMRGDGGTSEGGTAGGGGGFGGSGVARMAMMITVAVAVAESTLVTMGRMS
ncbi:hypothetical protein BGP_4933 [Beggiatoa sp. PS]|nr:hypothetical protein BGP_4933 [Beggiatoa sp. PS]